MPYIEVEKGVKVFVENIDPHPGHPVLFIHGWPVNHQMFEYQFDILPRYGFRCIGMDLRGYGKSDRPWNGYSYDRFADDILVVVKEFRLRDFTLVGFSLGGPISIRYMARHAGYRVSRLALISSASPVFVQRPDYPYGLPIAEVNDLLAKTYADRPKMLSEFGSKFFASAVSPDFRNWFQTLGLVASGHATAMSLVALRDEDVLEDLALIQVPAGIFHGVQDQIVPFQSALETQRGIADSALFPFEYSGHGVFYDELLKFNDAFLHFLSSPR